MNRILLGTVFGGVLAAGGVIGGEAVQYPPVSVAMAA